MSSYIIIYHHISSYIIICLYLYLSIYIYIFEWIIIDTQTAEDSGGKALAEPHRKLLPAHEPREMPSVTEGFLNREAWLDPGEWGYSGYSIPNVFFDN
jgi:hypothetical protein